MKSSGQPVETLESRLLWAVIGVSNNNDSGSGSLRAAIAAASDGDTISLAGRSGTITLTSGNLSVDKHLTFLGPGANVLAISGNNASRVFYIASGRSVNMSGLKISNGNAYSGAGISNNGTLTLDRVVISNNTAVAEGGGIDSNGLLSLTDCLISGNVSQNVGGGINVWQGVTMNRCTVANNSSNAQAIQDEDLGDIAGFGRGAGLARWQGNTSITNCTFVGNVASGESIGNDEGMARGGAIYVVNNGNFTMLNCTVTGNVASADDPEAGGIYLGTGSGSRTFTNCIIAGNMSSGGEKDFKSDIAATSGGNNLIGRIASGSVFVNGSNGDKVGTTAGPIDPKLDELADNGGQTQTVALLSGSPAINAGKDSAAPATDQRGQARVGQSDIGAYEVATVNAPPQVTSNPLGVATTRHAYVYSISATDPNGDDLTITAKSPLPHWLTLTNHGNGAASLVGTPGVNEVGGWMVALRVSDGQTFVDHEWAISVAAPRFQLETDGVLVIAGNHEANSIHAWVRGSNQLRVVHDGLVKNFDAGALTRIEIWGLDGDDTITMNTRTIAAYIAGGNGNDTITCGDEMDTVSGGAGKDLIFGGGGHDRLNGNGGNDILLGGPGLDRLYGGAGNDRLVGGEDGDQLRGEAGNDVLYARGDNTADLLIGGDGDDLAEVDDSDVMVDVLALL